MGIRNYSLTFIFTFLLMIEASWSYEANADMEKLQKLNNVIESISTYHQITLNDLESLLSAKFSANKNSNEYYTFYESETINHPIIYKATARKPISQKDLTLITLEVSSEAKIKDTDITEFYGEPEDINLILPETRSTIYFNEKDAEEARNSLPYKYFSYINNKSKTSFGFNIYGKLISVVIDFSIKK